jgi:hypothetical protein
MPPLGECGRPRFRIENPQQLADAIRALGRVAAADRPRVRRFIMRRARAMGLSNRIPDTWAPDGTLKGGGS